MSRIECTTWDNQAACTAEPQSGVPADYSEAEFLPDRNDVRSDPLVSSALSEFLYSSKLCLNNLICRRHNAN